MIVSCPRIEKVLDPVVSSHIALASRPWLAPGNNKSRGIEARQFASARDTVRPKTAGGIPSSSANKSQADKPASNNQDYYFSQHAHAHQLGINAWGDDETKYHVSNRDVVVQTTTTPPSSKPRLPVPELHLARTIPQPTTVDRPATAANGNGDRAHQSSQRTS
jgi:hypothetical protein